MKYFPPKIFNFHSFHLHSVTDIVSYFLRLRWLGRPLRIVCRRCTKMYSFLSRSWNKFMCSKRRRSVHKMESYFVGVDVGTGSVRAALVTKNGKLLHMSSKETKMWSPNVGYFEQSTDDIWSAVCRVVKVKQINLCLWLLPPVRVIGLMQIRKRFSLFVYILVILTSICIGREYVHINWWL